MPFSKFPYSHGITPRTLLNQHRAYLKFYCAHWYNVCIVRHTSSRCKILKEFNFLKNTTCVWFGLHTSPHSLLFSRACGTISAIDCLAKGATCIYVQQETNLIVKTCVDPSTITEEDEDDKKHSYIIVDYVSCRVLTCILPVVLCIGLAVVVVIGGIGLCFAK